MNGAWPPCGVATRRSPTQGGLTETKNKEMKIFLWILFMIFLIGLAVVFGLGSLIF
jgi:nitrate reductase NapE component